MVFAYDVLHSVGVGLCSSRYVGVNETSAVDGIYSRCNEPLCCSEGQALRNGLAGIQNGDIGCKVDSEEEIAVEKPAEV